MQSCLLLENEIQCCAVCCLLLRYCLLLLVVGCMCPLCQGFKDLFCHSQQTVEIWLDGGRKKSLTSQTSRYKPLIAPTNYHRTKTVQQIGGLPAKTLLSLRDDRFVRRADLVHFSFIVQYTTTRKEAIRLLAKVRGLDGPNAKPFK